MSFAPLQFTIVDEKNRCLWVRGDADFSARKAIAALEAMQLRFSEIKMFLMASLAIDNGAPPRRLLLRNPNLRTARLQAEAFHGAEPGVDENEGTGKAARGAASETVNQPGGGAAGSAETWGTGDAALVEVEVWHRRLLIRHLNYPGLSFATDAPERLPRADFEPVAGFLVGSHQPLNSVFRMSQNTSHIWLPGEDRRSTSIGDVLVVKGRNGTSDLNWLVMAMGFDRLQAFD